MKVGPWVLLVLALAYILFMQTCTGQGSVVTEDVFVALQNKYEDTLEAYHQFREKSDSTLDNATAIAIQANEKADQSLLALEQERLKVGRLMVMLDSAENEVPDSSWVSVSPRYKEACDSLRRVNLSLNYSIMQYVKDNQSHVDALGYEVHILDSLLDRERIFNGRFQRMLENCITTSKQQEKPLPRNQLYGGIAIWGNRVNLLSGGEINLSLRTRHDAIYEVKGAYMLNKWWLGVGTKFKFHFNQ